MTFKLYTGLLDSHYILTMICSRSLKEKKDKKKNANTEDDQEKKLANQSKKGKTSAEKKGAHNSSIDDTKNKDKEVKTVKIGMNL